jgi:hypothetical protein
MSALVALTACSSVYSTSGLVDVRRNNRDGVSWAYLGHMTVVTRGTFGVGLRLQLDAKGVSKVHDTARAEDNGVDPRYVSVIVTRSRYKWDDAVVYKNCYDLAVSVDGRSLAVGDTEYTGGLLGESERILAEVPTDEMRTLVNASKVEMIVCDDRLELLPEHIATLRSFARRLGDFPLALTPEDALSAPRPRAPVSSSSQRE